MAPTRGKKPRSPPLFLDGQSEFLVQAAHVPPQMDPEAQSLSLLQSLALQVAPVQVPSGHSVSRPQVEVPHLALLQRLLTGHAASPAQEAEPPV